MIGVPEPIAVGDATFVSTMQPAAAQRSAALVVAFASAIVFLAAAPFAKLPLAQIPGFLPVYQSALIVFDLVTSVLLLGQYRILRSPGLLYLAAAYVFSGVMAMAHTLSFPGLFAPNGVIGGPQSTAWIYFLWHGGFPLFVLGYALNKPHGGRLFAEGSARGPIYGTVALATLAAVVLSFMAAQFPASLPSLMYAQSDAPAKLVVASLTWLMVIGALAVIWRRAPHSVLDLWLMVVLCVWTADVALAAVLNGGRFDLGWYAGRMYGLLANGFVLAVLLLENGTLYARLAQTNLLLAQKSDDLEIALNDLQMANRDLQSFAGSLAHDLQQPLATIAAFSQVIQKDAHKIPAEDLAHLGKISAAAQVARNMIRALLEFARLGQARLHMTVVDLNQVVGEARSAVTGAAESRPIEWKIATLPKVKGDASLLLLAFINLLSNAVKYTRNQPHAAITVDAAWHAPDRWDIRIRDNGVGFDMTHASRLFRPFERLHTMAEFEGTGMGLANVRRILERHGTSIRAEGTPGKGALFTLQLPSAVEGPAPRNPGSSAQGNALAAARAAAQLP